MRLFFAAATYVCWYSFTYIVVFLVVIVVFHYFRSPILGYHFCDMKSGHSAAKLPIISHGILFT